MATYEAPTITELGSVQDLTLETINKTAGSGDVIVISGADPVPVPGGSVTSVS
jgi:hypothetical protein